MKPLMLLLIVSSSAAAAALVGVKLVHLPYFTESPSHLLDDLHGFEGRLKGVSGCAHCIHRRATGRLAPSPRLPAGAPAPSGLSRATHAVGRGSPALPLPVA